MRYLHSIFLLFISLGCVSNSLGQAATCQDDDLKNVAKKIADFPFTVQGKGYSAAQIEVLAAAYQDRLLNNMATACNTSGATASPAEAPNTKPAVQPAQGQGDTAPTMNSNGKGTAAAASAKTVQPANTTPQKAPGPQKNSSAAPGAAAVADPPKDVAPTAEAPAAAGSATCYAGSAGKIDTALAKPTLDALVANGEKRVTGKSGSAADGQMVQLCSLDSSKGTPVFTPLGSPVPVTSASSFTISPSDPIVAGESLVAQLSVTKSGVTSYSDVSATVQAKAPASCSEAGFGDGREIPSIKVLPGTVGEATVSGSVGDATVTRVRICIDDAPSVETVVDAAGNYSTVVTLGQGHKVSVQAVTSDAGVSPETYGVVSKKTHLGFLYSDRFFGSYIGGVEQSGYSAQVTNTNGFLSAYIRSAYANREPDQQSAVAAWGRVRLLSAPEPSPDNIAAAVADPTGEITKVDLTKVGEVVDFSGGIDWRLYQKDHSDGQSSRISIIAAFGETTPLTSDSQFFTFKAPTVNSTDCGVFLSRYTKDFPADGSVAKDTSTDTPACIWNPLTKTPYQFVSFTPQDRSRFLVKYGAGLRMTHVYPAKGAGASPYSGMLDLVFGQDEAITGGHKHGTVFKIDGQTPFPYGNLSSVYFFGSAALRILPNINQPLLTLATATSGSVPTIPDPAVFVLPQQQPNRDFYRIGVGLNILDIFSKLKGGLPAPAPAPAPAPVPAAVAATKP